MKTGSRVNVTEGRYKGRTGAVKEVNGNLVSVQLDPAPDMGRGTVLILQNAWQLELDLSHLREGDQPRPTPNDLPSIQALVRQDVTDRETVGISRYGTSLQPHNGRDALLDAYQEALDLATYLRQVLFERDGR